MCIGDSMCIVYRQCIVRVYVYRQCIVRVYVYRQCMCIGNV